MIDSGGPGDLAGEEAVEDHREVLADLRCRRLESPRGGVSAGTATPKDPVESLPEDDRPGRAGERFGEHCGALPLREALEQPRVRPAT